MSLPGCDDGCDDLKPTVKIVMKRLKMNLKQTKIDLKPEEVAELAQWVADYSSHCAILPDGVLDLSAPPSHDFKFEIVLTEPNPMWKSHTDKFSPQQKSELTRRVEEKLRQRIIEKSPKKIRKVFEAQKQEFEEFKEAMAAKHDEIDA